MFGLKFPAGNLVEGEGQSLLWGCCARGPWVFHSGITGMMHHLYRIRIFISRRVVVFQTVSLRNVGERLQLGQFNVQSGLNHYKGVIHFLFNVY